MPPRRSGSTCRPPILAAETEFWRAHRKAAAVMHFTTLGYSRPDGQTSDHWKQGGVAKLEWEPEFYRYVRDAFAPVGLMVDYWKDRPVQGTKARVPVMLINDLDNAWSGPVALKLRPAGSATPILEVRQDAHLPPFGQATLDFEVAWPQPLGQYALEAELRARMACRSTACARWRSSGRLRRIIRNQRRRKWISNQRRSWCPSTFPVLNFSRSSRREPSPMPAGMCCPIACSRRGTIPPTLLLP